MKIYDIIHAEDEGTVRNLLGKEARKNGMTYFGVSTLKELELTLKNKNLARVYVIDDKFPSDSGCKIESLADKAAEIIRSLHLESKIVFYSLSDIGDIARKFDAGCASKKITPAELAVMIKKQHDARRVF